MLSLMARSTSLIALGAMSYFAAVSGRVLLADQPGEPIDPAVENSTGALDYYIADERAA
jgi:hypothetical protein